jgi:hypothetical protein
LPNTALKVRAIRLMFKRGNSPLTIVVAVGDVLDTAKDGFILLPMEPVIATVVE